MLNVSERSLTFKNRNLSLVSRRKYKTILFNRNRFHFFYSNNHNSMVPLATQTTKSKFNWKHVREEIFSDVRSEKSLVLWASLNSCDSWCHHRSNRKLCFFFVLFIFFFNRNKSDRSTVYFDERNRKEVFFFFCNRLSNY